MGFVWILGGIVAVLFAISMIVAQRSFAPWVPSSTKMARTALAKIAPEPGKRFIDLGCGDGRIVMLAAREFSLHADGVEVSPLPLMLARLRLGRTWGITARIMAKNLYTMDLAPYDIVYCYGLPEALKSERFQAMLAKMKPGARLISNYFQMPNKKPDDVIRDRYRTIYLYTA